MGKFMKKLRKKVAKFWSKLSFQTKPLTKKQKAIVLPAMVVVGGGAIALAVFTIIVMPGILRNPNYGVGADGFTAYEEQGTDLGVGKLVTQADVITALGAKSKQIKSSDVSNVFNYNGDRSQTATYNFVRPDNINASLYIDMTQFKSSDSMNAQQIFTETALARIINGHSAYYMHAQSIGSQREYRMMVVSGLNAYKFVIDQPVNNIKIDEVSAVASLIALAQKAAIQ